MLRFTDCKNRREWLWFARVFILLVVCTLAVNVATRYSSADSFSGYSKATLHGGLSPESRQRLTKDVSEWMPPMVHLIALAAPVLYSRSVPASPPVRNCAFAESLYNRPPPKV
jgi:hypothetical protein